MSPSTTSSAGPRLDDRPERPETLGLLRLDANEGPLPPPELTAILERLDPERLRRYPDSAPLEARIAARLGVQPRQVLVGTGGDGTIASFAGALLGPSAGPAPVPFVCTTPTFGMIPANARLFGADLREVPWFDGPFPLEAFLEAARAPRACAAIVSPNNPTGVTVEWDAVARVSERLREGALLLDLAYEEFAEQDLATPALELPNVLQLRTLSKAFGLAGLRVGYLVGPEPWIDRLRAVAPPYPCSGLALAVAERALDLGSLPDRLVLQAIAERRDALRERLLEAGFDVPRSQANFLCVRGERAPDLFEGLRREGVLVRQFANRPDLANCLRITAPTSPAERARLDAALDTVLPELAQ
ncbi:MAG: histidinol-phosphate transaminase [Planctomycetota bacterium]